LLKNHFLELFEILIEGLSDLTVVLQSKKVRNDFEFKPQGHLVLMTCGHRGRPSRQEEKRISRLLRKSTYIPMLEELYGITPATVSPRKEAEKSTLEG
jgi:hypothetical protein